ncbi:MAG: phenylacetate-CoA oxygenase subunit PaaI [Rhodospirillales bacterium]|nr:phenylacetate-CoA oxygenase subunit PaaI [Rhodospirillales bacterium]
MPADEKGLLKTIKSGRKISNPDKMTPGYRGEVIRLMTIFVDTELAWAAGYADSINRAPGMRERVVAAQIAAEKLGHAEQGMSLLEAFGVNPGLYIRSHAWTARLDRTLDLRNRQVGDDKRLNVLHYPLEGWTDAVVMNFLLGEATVIHLGELAACSYAPLARAMTAIVKRETGHAESAEKGVKQAIGRDATPAAAQVAVDYWYPRVGATFGRIDSDRLKLYQGYGLRKCSNAQLLKTWERAVARKLKRLKLKAPA